MDDKTRALRCDNCDLTACPVCGRNCNDMADTIEAQAKRIEELEGDMSPGVAKAMKVFWDGLAKRRAREHGLPWRVAPWGDGSSPTGHSNIFSDTWQVTIASELLTETAEFIVASVNALGEAPPPKFEKTFCSQCGGEFGPGDSGYSHCVDHEFDEALAAGKEK